MIEDLTYKLAELDDFDDFYTIKCDPDNIAWGGFSEKPERNNFLNWYKSQLEGDMRKIYLAYLSGKICAFFYLDKIDDDTYDAASSGVLKEYTGRGIGTFLIEESISEVRRMGGKKVIGWVAEGNIASWQRCRNCGFERTDIYEERKLSLLGGTHRFYKWIKVL